MPPQAPFQALSDSAHAAWKHLETYLLRLPILTRIVILLIAVIHMLEVCGFGMLDWMALDVGKMNFGQSWTFRCLLFYLFVIKWGVRANCERGGW